MHIDEFRIEAIQALTPAGTQWGFMSDADGGYEVTFHNPSSDDPTNAEIDVEVIRLKASYDSLAYSRTRATLFPALTDQLDLLFHDMTAGKGTKTGEWYKAVALVKSDNPKPE